jgi:antitoxin MazE
MLVETLRAEFAARGTNARVSALPEFADGALTLGAGAKLADASAPDRQAEADRAVALLSVALGRPLNEVQRAHARRARTAAIGRTAIRWRRPAGLVTRRPVSPDFASPPARGRLARSPRIERALVRLGGIYYVDTYHGGLIMRATIAKWGNSLALRLPRNIAEGAKLVEGAPVDLEVEGDSIRVTPRRPKFKLADLLIGERASGEVDWGEPKGDEVW